MGKTTNTERIEALEKQIRTLAASIDKVTNTLEEVAGHYNEAFKIITIGFNHLTATIKKLAEVAGFKFDEPDVPAKLHLVPDEEEE